MNGMREAFDDDLRLVLSPSLREHCTNAAFKSHFAAYEGRRIDPPARHRPEPALLGRHRKSLA